MYSIKEASSSLLLTDLILLLNENKHSEHDCDREVYINSVIGTMYLKPNHRITVLYANEKPIGYLILRQDKYIMNEIVVIDIYITKKYQGKECIQLLLDEIVPTVFNSGAKRIRWQSFIFDDEFWSKHTFGLEVKSYKMFYVELDSDNKNKIEGRKE